MCKIGGGGVAVVMAIVSATKRLWATPPPMLGARPFFAYDH